MSGAFAWNMNFRSPIFSVRICTAYEPICRSRSPILSISFVSNGPKWTGCLFDLHALGRSLDCFSHLWVHSSSIFWCVISGPSHVASLKSTSSCSFYLLLLAVLAVTPSSCGLSLGPGPSWSSFLQLTILLVRYRLSGAVIDSVSLCRITAFLYAPKATFRHLFCFFSSALTPPLALSLPLWAN